MKNWNLYYIERVLMDFNEDSLMNIISLFDLWHRLGVFVFFPSRLRVSFRKNKGTGGRTGWPFSLNWNTQSCPTNPKIY
jgi:hypothetical protein